MKLGSGCKLQQRCAPIAPHGAVVQPYRRSVALRVLTDSISVKEPQKQQQQQQRSLRAEPVSGVLLDIDGVVCCGGVCGNKAIPGAAEAVRDLKAAALPYKFVTNTTTDQRSGIAARLARSGIPCTPDDIISPAVCAAQYLKQHSIGPTALFVSEAVLPDFGDCELLPVDAATGAAAVVLGDMGPAWHYNSLNRAFRLMMQQPQPLLLSLGKSRFYKDCDGLSLDVGPFTAAIEFATGATAITLGKPASSVFHLAAQSLGLSPQQVVMVGDDIQGDVGGAHAAGLLAGILVRTGKYRPGDESGGDVLPDAVLESVAELPAWIAEHNLLVKNSSRSAQSKQQ